MNDIKYGLLLVTAAGDMSGRGSTVRRDEFETTDLEAAHVEAERIEKADGYYTYAHVIVIDDPFRKKVRGR